MVRVFSVKLAAAADLLPAPPIDNGPSSAESLLEKTRLAQSVGHMLTRY